MKLLNNIKLNFDFKLDKAKDILLLFNNMYLFLLGLIWISIHVYIRIILDRPTYTFTEIKEQLNLKIIIIFLCFIIIQLCIIILSIVTMLKRSRSLNTRSFYYKQYQKFVSILNLIYWEPLNFVHNKIAPRIPGSGRFFLYLETKWKTKSFTYIVIAVFDILPKMVIACIFFIECIFFQEISFFVYVLPLFLLPLILSVFLKLFFSFANRNAPVLREYFESINGIGEPIKDSEDCIVDYISYEVIVKPEYIDVIDPREEMAVLLQLRRIYDIVLFTKETLGTVSPYTLFITSLLYLIGGLYRLVGILF